LPVIPIDAVGSGLRPADGSSVVPMAFPVGGTDVPAVMPVGDVMPMPATVLSICASAGAQPNSAARINAIKTGRVLVRMATRARSARGRDHRLNATSSIGRSGGCGASFSASASPRVGGSEGEAECGLIECRLFAIGASGKVVVLTLSLLTGISCSSGVPRFKYVVDSRRSPWPRLSSLEMFCGNNPNDLGTAFQRPAASRSTGRHAAASVADTSDRCSFADDSGLITWMELSMRGTGIV
jgi:hypothetical protein